MAIIIPTRSDLPAYEFRIDIDERVFTLSFRYNLRMDSWIMDIKTQDGEPLRMGIPVQTAVKLLNDNRKDSLPLGDFIFVHETGLYLDASREDLGSIVKLFYFEAE